MAVARRYVNVEERSEWIENVVYRNDMLQWGETEGQRGVQKTAGIGDELAWLSLWRAIAVLLSMLEPQ